MLEIRARITELLVSYQSEITVGDLGTWNGIVDIQANVDEPRAIALSWTSPVLQSH